MVGFDLLSQECPSVSFFFARLGVFLEYSSCRCPQVGLLVPRSSALKPVLLFLHPLIHEALIRHHSEMDTIQYRVDDVQSSELKTGLSSNADSLSREVDIAVSKLPSSSSSCPLHVLSESCCLKESHLIGRGLSFLKGPPLGCLAWVRKPTTLLTERCVSMRLTFCVAFGSPSTHLSCIF